MIVPDVNLVVYAEVDAYPEHRAAREWWERAVNDGEEVGIALPAMFGFIRIVTNPRVLDPPMTVDTALDRVTGWLDRPTVRVLVPGPRHVEIAFRLLRSLGTAANLTTDVQLAALAIEFGATVHSNDIDFGRFPGLAWRNPLAA